MSWVVEVDVGGWGRSACMTALAACDATQEAVIDRFRTMALDEYGLKPLEAAIHVARMLQGHETTVIYMIYRIVETQE